MICGLYPELERYLSWGDPPLSGIARRGEREDADNDGERNVDGGEHNVEGVEHDVEGVEHDGETAD